MGIVSSLLSQSNNNMKFLLVVAVAAYAKAEADPGFAYSIGHVPLTYAHAPVAYGAPLVYAAPAAGCQNSEGKFVPCAQGSYFGYVPIAAAAPAEEADPEADPWLYYSDLYGHHGYGLGYHYAPLTYTYAPYTYSHVYGHYGLGHYGYFGRKKREAEAEPEATADPEADPWLLYGGWGYGGYHYAPYTYAAYHHPLTYFYGGCRNNQGALVPCAGR